MKEMMELPQTIQKAFRFFAYWLFIMATWTLLIKFILPIVYVVYLDDKITKPTSFIMWDFWWVVHIALGICLLNYKSWVRYFALIVSFTEIIIVVVKFTLYFMNPEFGFWKLNWFINKIFILVLFIALFYYLMRRSTRQRLQVRGI